MGAAIAIAPLIKAVVVGAIVGAVVGGITAAIKGGDIFKGVLFGAIGGAVTGGLAYGVSTAFSSMMGTTTSAASAVTPAASIPGTAAQELASKAFVPGTIASEAVTTATETSFLGGLWDDITGSFSGDGLGGALTEGALSSGITSVAGMYQQNKALESAEEQAEKNRAHEHSILDKNIAANKEIASIRSGGGGGGGGGLSAEEQRMLIQEQNKGGLERVQAEISGQSALRSQEFANSDRLRQTAADAGAGLAASGRQVASTSTDTLVDIQDRIREGENSEGAVNSAVEVPVKYVAPESEYVV